MNVDTSTRGLAYLTDAAGRLPNTSVILHAAKECNERQNRKKNGPIATKSCDEIRNGRARGREKNGNKSIATLSK